MKNLFQDSAKWLTFSALVVITSPIQANALTINSALGNRNPYSMAGTASGNANPTTPTGFIGGTTLTTFSDTSQRSAWVEGVNYVQFTGLRSVGGSLTVQNRALNDKFSMNGFQLQAVPAPLPLLGVGAAFHFSRKLRKITQGSTNSVSSTYNL